MSDYKNLFLNIAQSVNGQSWLERLVGAGSNNALAISQKYGLPDQLSRVLSGRDVDESDAVEFLSPTLKNLMPNPKSFTDMDKASKRIIQAIQQNEFVAIFGDYDVDGACSSALLARFFHFYGISTRIYIPDRLVEGYGPNPQAMKMLVDDGAKLIVTVDCGANSPDAIVAARDAGADVVVLDHHQMGEQASIAANALVNPNRLDDISGQGHLCAAGVVFLTLVEVCRQFRESGKKTPDLLSYLDLVALATVCDVVPLQGVNRAFVVKGLQVARMQHNVGLMALTRVARIDSPLNGFHFGYLLGPRINAGGRIGDQALGARLLSTDDVQEAEMIANELNNLNQERQAIESAQLEEAEAQLFFETNDNQEYSAIVVANRDWHPGIVGLLAARLKERFSCPAIAIALKDDGTGSGSARSIKGIDIGAVIRKATEEGLLLKGGGHTMAAGLTIEADKVDVFRDWIQKTIAPTVEDLNNTRSLLIDGALTSTGATIELSQILEHAGPYGSGNPDPVFVLPNHKISYVREVGVGHLSIEILDQNGTKLKAIAFRSVGPPLGDFLQGKNGQTIHFAGILGVNHWNGRVTPQLRIIDAAEPNF